MFSVGHVHGLTLPSLDCFYLSRLSDIWSTEEISVPELLRWDLYRIMLILLISFLSQAVIFYPQA